MLALDKDNPSPFKQPFLELTIAGGGVPRISDNGSQLYIDVDGQIDKYITEDHQPTLRLVELCKSFAKAGVVVTEYARYVGSGGPSVIMRHGALFYRMRSVEDPPEDVFAYEYREPKYRGPK